MILDVTPAELAELKRLVKRRLEIAIDVRDATTASRYCLYPGDERVKVLGELLAKLKATAKR